VYIKIQIYQWKSENIFGEPQLVCVRDLDAPVW